MMASLSFLVCAVVAFWLFRKFWSLRKLLHHVQEVDVDITSSGMYASLPIYHYMSCHLHFVLTASGTMFLMSLAFAATPLFDEGIDGFCPLPFLDVVATLLTVILGVHTAFIACYESTKPNSRITDPDIQCRLQGFRQKLWTHALLLFSLVMAVLLWQAALSALS